jgi:hypothetical protein
VYPIANFVAIFAIGKPVALDASAEERETRGRHYAESDVAAPHAGDTPTKATGRRAVAEARRTLSGRPSSSRCCLGSWA